MNEKLIFGEKLQKYLPNIYCLTLKKHAKITKKISEYLERLRSLPIDFTIDKPHCIFDWIIMAEEGYDQAISYLNFIDDQCFELYNLVDQQFRDKTVSTILEMLTTLDKDWKMSNNPKYQSFIAEIVGLLYLLKLSKDTFKLIAIEGLLFNGMKADFVFEKLETWEKIYIDAVSFNCIYTTKIDTNEDLIKQLNNKTKRKFAKKTKSLKPNGNQIIVNNEKVTFVILPFIWIEHSELLPYKSVFEYLDKHSEKTFQCCSIYPQKTNAGKYIYQMASVKNILNQMLQQEIL